MWHMPEWGSGANCIGSCKCHTGILVFEGKAEIPSCVLCQSDVSNNHRHPTTSYPNIFSLASWAGCSMWLCCLPSTLHSNIIWICWLVLVTVERKTEVSNTLSFYVFCENRWSGKGELCLSSFQLKQQLLNTLFYPRDSTQEGMGRGKGSSCQKSIRQTSDLVRHMVIQL